MKPTTGKKSIATNRKARHDYHIEEDFEAGLVLEGWEVKSLREGRVTIAEGYVHVRNGEAWFTNCNISPLKTASTHITPEPTRQRKLLLNRREIDKLSGAVDRSGYSLVPLDLYFVRGRAKLKIGLGKGKKDYDKRQDKKKADWNRQKARIMKNG